MKVLANLVEAHIFKKKENDIEFLLLKRAESEIYPGLWQMVTGSIANETEKGFEAALREIKEETGLVPDRFWVVPNINSFYWPEKDCICNIPVFAALAALDFNVKISDEHSDYKWVSKEEALKLLAWPGQRRSVEIIHEYFPSQKSFLNFVEIPLSKEKN